MSDTGDLVVALGQLERAVESLEGEAAARARAAAATVIPAFDAPGAAGWYDRFLETAGPEPEAATLSAAVQNLVLRSERPRAGLLAHRVIVIAAIARALPERFGPTGTESEAVQLALSGHGILRSAPGVFDDPRGPEPVILDEAPAFLARLVDPALLPSIGALKDFLAHPDVRALVHAELIAAPAPCSTELIDVPSAAGVRVAVALVTRVCVTGVTLADLAAENSFFNPGNWSSYSYWCGMTRDGPATDPAAAGRFLESVALDCQRGWFEVSVWLDFSQLVKTANGLIRSYRMSADQSATAGGAGANGAVDVDEGTIKAVDQGGHVLVKTTKRIHFTLPVDPAALAILSCAAGYGALSADFVVEGTGGRAKDTECPRAAYTAGDGTQADEADDPLAAGLDALGRTAKECITAAKVGLDKATAGTYTADDLAGDVAASIVRSARAGGQLVELALAVARPTRRGGEIVSDPFTLPAPAQGQLRLVLGGPLTSAWGGTIPVELVRFDPEPLPAGSDTFVLAVRPAGLVGTAFFGVVDAVDPATGQHHRIPVDVQIP